MRAILASPTRLQLWSEFVLLFIGVPILMLAFFGQYSLFGLIWTLAALSVGLLAMTPGFTWDMLWKGPVFTEWRLILGFWVVTALASAGFVFAIDPSMFLSFALARPEFWLLVMVAYPLASALPQEIIFRSLFFERYGDLFSSPAMLIAANGFVFGFGHLFYQNWVTISMTAVGGAIMGWAYLRGRSMLLAWVLHALAGQLVFTMGLGRYFYHGAV